MSLQVIRNVDCVCIALSKVCTCILQISTYRLSYIIRTGFIALLCGCVPTTGSREGDYRLAFSLYYTAFVFHKSLVSRAQAAKKSDELSKWRLKQVLIGTWFNLMYLFRSLRDYSREFTRFFWGGALLFSFCGIKWLTMSSGKARVHQSWFIWITHVTMSLPFSFSTG